MRPYELTFLISQNLSEEEIRNLQEKIKNFIEDEGGVLVEIKSLGKKNRFYTKTGGAYLSILNFNLEPEKLENLEKKLKSENQILRYLVSKRVMKMVTPLPKISLTPVKKNKKAKIKLKEIEEKLEEILGET